MKATAQRTNNAYTHTVTIGQHTLVADEPLDEGGDDQGPSPTELLAASLATCTAVTLEMYAQRKGWNVGPVEVEVEYDLPERGATTVFQIVLRLRSDLDEARVERLQAIAAKCPVHRILEGDVAFEDRVELIAPTIPRS